MKSLRYGLHSRRLLLLGLGCAIAFASLRHILSAVPMNIRDGTTAPALPSSTLPASIQAPSINITRSDSVHVDEVLPGTPVTVRAGGDVVVRYMPSNLASGSLPVSVPLAPIDIITSAGKVTLINLPAGTPVNIRATMFANILFASGLPSDKPGKIHVETLGQVHVDEVLPGTPVTVRAGGDVVVRYMPSGVSSASAQTAPVDIRTSAGKVTLINLPPSTNVGDVHCPGGLSIAR